MCLIVYVSRLVFLACPVWPVQRGYDPHGGLQHAQGLQGQRDHQAVGHRRPAAVPLHVGALLPRRQRHRVSTSCGLMQLTHIMRLN